MGDLQQYPQEISDLICKMLTMLSMQCPIIATVLALIFKAEPDFVDLVVERVKLALLGALKDDAVLTAKLALRALASLASCRCLATDGSGGLTLLLSTLLDAATTNSGPGSDLSGHAMILFYLVGHTLPYCSAVLAQDAAGQAFLARAVATFTPAVAAYRSPFSAGGSRAIFHAYAAPLDDDGNIISTAAKGCLSLGPDQAAAYDTLYDAMVIGLAAASGGASSSLDACTPMPWVALQAELSAPPTGSFKGGPPAATLELTTSSDFFAGLADVLDSGAVGATLLAPERGGPTGAHQISWLIPRFPLLDAETAPQAQALTQVPYEVRAALVGFYADQLHFFEPKVLDDGTRMGSNHLLVKHLTSVQNLLYLTLTTSGTDLTTVSFLPLLAELLLQSLLTNPIEPARFGMVFRILLELAIKVSEFPPLLAACTSQLYYGLNEMDASSLRSLAKWLSMHIINTKLSWPYWAAWVTDCEEEAAGSNKVLFCRLVVDHLGRACMGELVRLAVPPSLHDAMPADPRPSKPMLGGDVDFEPLYDAILDKIDDQIEVDDLITYLENGAGALVPAGQEGEEAWRSTLLLHACVTMGGAAPSKVIGKLDRYSEALVAFATLPASQLALVQVLTRCVALFFDLVAISDLILKTHPLPAPTSFPCRRHQPTNQPQPRARAWILADPP